MALHGGTDFEEWGFGGYLDEGGLRDEVERLARPGRGCPPYGHLKKEVAVRRRGRADGAVEQYHRL